MGKNKVGLSLNELHTQNKKIVYDKVLPYYEHYYVIVPDIASGTKKRYTVYKLSVTGKEATIVGRELDLKYANEFTDKLILQDIEHAKKLEERDKKYAYKNELNDCLFDSRYNLRLLSLLLKWDAESALYSLDERFDTVEYRHCCREIDRLGCKTVIKTLLYALRVYSVYVFRLLEDVTGENPIKKEDYGKIEKMKKAWLNWGKKNGYE